MGALHQPSARDQIAFFRSLICTGACWNSATCGTHQGSGKDDLILLEGLVVTGGGGGTVLCSIATRRVGCMWLCPVFRYLAVLSLFSHTPCTAGIELPLPYNCFADGKLWKQINIRVQAIVFRVYRVTGGTRGRVYEGTPYTYTLHLHQVSGCCLQGV